MIETKPEPRKFTAVEIAAMVRLFRTERGWSQETLAELCRINVRTIQRLEAGEPGSEASLRAIARAFETTDIDFFNRLHQIPTEEEIKAAQENFLKDNMLLEATVAISGRELGELYATCTADISRVAMELSSEAASEFAALTDYLRDYRDLAPDCGEIEKLTYIEEVQEMLGRLNALDIDICYATRDVKLVGKDWKDKTPWPVKLAYLTAFHRGKAPSRMAVPKAVQV